MSNPFPDRLTRALIELSILDFECRCLATGARRELNANACVVMDRPLSLLPVATA